MAHIWIISDGKPGHLNQSLGLAEALQRLQPNTQVTTKPALSKVQAFSQLFSRTSESDTPDLIIGAGHRTHLSLLAYRRSTGAPAVLMMKPSLPSSWFDLCLIPEHDAPLPVDNIVSTSGALNRMQPLADRQKSGPDMVLIGGPSKHFGWDDDAMLKQVQAICAQSGEWLLTTSRRTPESFVGALRQQLPENLQLVPFEETGPGWLAQHLPKANACWVSGDSVSMVFEALTAGCAVGVLDVPRLSENRISRGLDLLIEAGKVTNFHSWRAGQQLTKPETVFNEADRCAEIVKARLLP